jgi:hypothetical protein
LQFELLRFAIEQVRSARFDITGGRNHPQVFVFGVGGEVELHAGEPGLQPLVIGFVGFVFPIHTLAVVIIDSSE